jgi:signal recognition particle receptor subunit alpha
VKKAREALKNKFTKQNTVKESSNKSLFTSFTDDKQKSGRDWMNISEKVN